MLYCRESNGKVQNLFIPNKTATLIPEFAVEDLHLGRTAALVPEFAVKYLPLGTTLMMMMNQTLNNGFVPSVVMKHSFVTLKSTK